MDHISQSNWDKDYDQAQDDGRSSWYSYTRDSYTRHNDITLEERDPVLTDKTRS